MILPVRLLLVLSLACAIAAAQVPVCAVARDQGMPAACFDGRDFLVAWTDMRDYERDSTYNIYAGRVDAQGNPLDSTGFAVVTDQVEQTQPRACFGLDDCLLIWSDGC
jgi:hypothetical protein